MMLVAPLIGILLSQTPMTTITGVVVGPGGEPVVGADLILVGLPSYDPPIVARGKSREGGQFALDRPSSLAGDHHPQRAPILWAVKPGFRVSVTRFPEALPKPDEPLRIVLEPPGKAKVLVEGPNGQPLSGVRVLPERLKTHYTVFPNVVAELASATTGPDGLAILDAVPPEELVYVDIHSHDFGIQGKFVTPQGSRPVEIALRPVSTVKGRLTGADPTHARKWRVRAWTRMGGDPGSPPRTTGYVDTTTDDEGRFTLAPIAIGGLQLQFEPPGDLPVLPESPPVLTVRERHESTLEIPLKKWVTVTGIFVERGTGKPVPGISATLIDLGGNRRESQTVKTDEQGRYTFRALPGLVRVGHFNFPPTHVQSPSQGWEDFTVPEPPGAVQLATREALPAAGPLRGQVVDEQGRPVPGALVRASWLLGGAKGTSGGNVEAKTDEQGNFVLGGLGPDSTVTITGKLRDRQSTTPLQTQAGAAEAVRVVINPISTLALNGRLLGPEGKPVADIPIKIQFRVEKNNFPGFPQPVQFEGNPEIKTGPDGSFRTPKELEGKPREFRIQVSAEGFFPAESEWVPASEGDLLTVPDVVLKPQRKARSVAGRVVDRNGQPVPEALVSQAGDGERWTSTKTDADGRFRLTGVAEGEALIFAEAPAFRFGGTVVHSKEDAVEIRLGRQTEPPLPLGKPLPPPLTRKEERALARELLEPVLRSYRSGSIAPHQASPLLILARVEPEAVLEMIENRVISDLSGALQQAALGQYEDDPAAAIATVEADLNPDSRPLAWLALHDFRPVAERAQREDLLNRALTDTRKPMPLPLKIQRIGQIADRWLELGVLDKAKSILQEGQKIVAEWPKNDWSQEAEDFGEVLAVIDLPTSIALFERRGKTTVSPADEASIHRHKGQAAIRLAALAPEQAERLIGPPSPSFDQRPAIVLKVARKMARVDLARARRILKSLDAPSDAGISSDRALVFFGLGLIAAELSGSDPVQARALLDEAFTGLRKIAVDEPLTPRQASLSTLMAALLSVVERVDADRLPERLWLAAASRPPFLQKPTSREVEAGATLAMRFAPYDRAIADAVAASAMERLVNMVPEFLGYYGNELPTAFKCLAAYDPRCIAPLLPNLPKLSRRSLQNGGSWDPLNLDDQLRLATAEILGLPRQARFREAGRIGNSLGIYDLD